MQTTFGRVISEATTATEWWAVVGQWVGALGTVAAVAVALWLAVREQRSAAAERRDAAAAQARLISTEVVYPDLSDALPVRVIRIVNHSDRPVFDPRLVNVRNSSPGVVGWDIDGDVDYEFVDVLAAGDTHAIPFRPRTATGVATQYAERDIPVINFTDANGLRWQREGNTEPTRLTT